MIQNPNDGYLITLASNSAIVSTPVTGSDGKNYYRVGEPIVISSIDSAVKATGAAKCIGRTWGEQVRGLLVVIVLTTGYSCMSLKPLR